MLEKYLKELLLNCAIYGFLLAIVGFVLNSMSIVTTYPIELIIPVILLYSLIVSYQTHKEILNKETREFTKKYDSDIAKYNGQLRQAEYYLNHANKEAEVAKNREALWKKTLQERASGYPTLLAYIEELEKDMDDWTSNRLRNKAHPAIKSSEIVSLESKKRRDAEKELRRIKAINEYYENIAPFLLDFKDQIVEDEDEEFLKGYTEEEKEDPVSHFLAVEEYKKLSTIERNQMALDRFWKRPKSKWLLGRLYERYVGYLYEKEGYDVDYVGVFKGYEDLGRDLICSKGKEVIIIQCKNWSKFKTIFEKHIFQFFGTVFQYKDQSSDRDIKAIFYTTTTVSDLARRFAKELGIELKENFKFNDKYPCIKCNISKADGKKIYHLPFDQQYDTTKIEPKEGEYYLTSVKEAEDRGFRRAFRWKGQLKHS